MDETQRDTFLTVTEIFDRLTALHREHEDRLEQRATEVAETEHEQRLLALADREAKLGEAFEALRKAEPDVLALRVQYVSPLTRGAVSFDGVDSIEAGERLIERYRALSERFRDLADARAADAGRRMLAGISKRYLNAAHSVSKLENFPVV